MWKAAFIAVILHVTLVTGESSQNHVLPDTAANVWYSQIGAWHLILDTLSGTSHLYHNAAIDGATSGQARADLKFNRRIRGLTHLTTVISPGRASVAGILLKDKKLAYGVYLEKGTGSDTVTIVRRFDKQKTLIMAYPVPAADTQYLDLTLSPDSLKIHVGNVIRGIRKPVDLPGEAIVVLSCERGEVRVFGVRIEAASTRISESFAQATIINMGMERMFQGSRKHAK